MNAHGPATEPLPRRLDIALDVAEQALRRLAAERTIVGAGCRSLIASRVEAYGAICRLYVALGERPERLRAIDQGVAVCPDLTAACPDPATLTRWADAWAAFGDALEAQPRPMLDGATAWVTPADLRRLADEAERRLAGGES